MARNEIVERENDLGNSIPGIDAELMSSMKEEVLRAMEGEYPHDPGFLKLWPEKAGLRLIR